MRMLVLRFIMEEIKGELKENLSEKDIEKRKSKLYKFFFGWVKDNYDRAFLLLLAVAFVVGLWIFSITRGQPVWYDTANFLSTAKRFAIGLDYVNDIWYYRRGFFWVLFFIGRSMTEIPASFFLITSLFFFWKGYVLKKGNKFLYLFGVFYALALLTRFQLAMFIFPLLLFILIKERFNFIKNKHLWITLGIILAILLPFFILYFMHYGNVFADVLSHYFGVSVAPDTPTGFNFIGIFDYFRDLPYILASVKSVIAPLFIVFLIGAFIFFQDMFLGIDKIFKNEEIQKKFFIFIWIVSALLILGYMTSASYIEERYAIPTYIFLFLIIASFFVKLEGLLVKYLKLKKVLAIMLSFLILLGMTIPGILFANGLIEIKKTYYLKPMNLGNMIIPKKRI